MVDIQSAAAEIRRGKGGEEEEETGPKYNVRYAGRPQLECGPMSNAQPNTSGALCESSVIPFLVPRHKVWSTPSAEVSCSNAANI